ncbi:MAG: MFS transporter, partial [Candidatus Bathyarchaeia archaeon]
MNIRQYFYIYIYGFILMLASGMVLPIFPLFSKTLTESYFLIGLVSSVFWIARLIFEVPAGHIADVISKRVLMLLGISISGLSLCSTALAADIFQIMALRPINAIGSVLFFLSSLSYIAESAPEEIRGKCISILQAVEFGTLSVAAPLGGYLASLVGYRATFFLNGLILLLGSLILIFIPFKEISPSKDGINTSHFSKDMYKGFLRMLYKKEVFIANIAILSIQFPESLAMLMVPLYAREVMKLGEAQIGLIMAPRGLGVAIGTLIGGVLFDKYPKAYSLTYFFAFALVDFSIGSFILAENPLSLSLLLCLISVAYGIAYSITPSVVAFSLKGKSSLGVAMGVWRTFFDLGGTVSPSILSSIAEVMGLRYPFFMMLYLACIICVLMVLSFSYEKFIAK